MRPGVPSCSPIPASSTRSWKRITAPPGSSATPPSASSSGSGTSTGLAVGTPRSRTTSGSIAARPRRCSCRSPTRRAMPSATSERPWRSSAGWSRRPTTSYWTCPTATVASLKRTRPRPPGRSWTATSQPSRSWAECPRASCTTIPSWRWPGYWETVGASAPRHSLSCSLTTCSTTGSDAPPRGMTRERSRGCQGRRQSGPLGRRNGGSPEWWQLAGQGEVETESGDVSRLGR